MNTKYELGEYVLAKDHERYIIGKIISISSVFKVALTKEQEDKVTYTISYLSRVYANLADKEIETTEDNILFLVTNGTFNRIDELEYCTDNFNKPYYNISARVYVDNQPYIVYENKLYNSNLGEYVYLLRSEDAAGLFVFKYAYQIYSNKVDENKYRETIKAAKKAEEEAKLAVHIDYEEDEIPKEIFENKKLKEHLNNAYKYGDIVVIERTINTDVNIHNDLYDGNIIITKAYKVKDWMVKDDMFYYVCIPLNYELDYPILVPYYDIKDKLELENEVVVQNISI